MVPAAPAAVSVWPVVLPVAREQAPGARTVRRQEVSRRRPVSETAEGFERRSSGTR
jgi:hypothetical protein